MSSHFPSIYLQDSLQLVFSLVCFQHHFMNANYYVTLGLLVSQMSTHGFLKFMIWRWTKTSLQDHNIPWEIMWWEPSPGVGGLDKAPYGLSFDTQQISLILTHLESANTWKIKNHFNIAKTYLQGKTAVFIVFLYHIPKSVIKYIWTFCFLGWSAHQFSSSIDDICICPHSKGFKTITWVVGEKVKIHLGIEKKSL